MLLKVGFLPAATPWATGTKGGLKQVRVPGDVYASTHGMSDSRTSHLSSFSQQQYIPSPSIAPYPPGCSVATDYLPPATSTNSNTTSAAAPSTSDGDSVLTCPYCDHTFTSHISLVGHLPIHRAETGEPLYGAQTYSRRARLHCPHCFRTFAHRMGLLGHMRLHDNLQ
ncbi:unnamed protein product [Schistocephalus solidus]|uniref:C2H2-type domain-containing protein n=1 Tax=Schistocephalus solidus TaxID=70667 RepID=A0A3P7E807_SCHSO|nr:unnamed protein product [Schistocephalus solidus]